MNITFHSRLIIYLFYKKRFQDTITVCTCKSLRIELQRGSNLLECNLYVMDTSIQCVMLNVIYTYVALVCIGLNEG